MRNRSERLRETFDAVANEKMKNFCVHIVGGIMNHPHDETEAELIRFREDSDGAVQQLFNVLTVSIDNAYEVTVPMARGILLSISCQFDNGRFLEGLDMELTAIEIVKFLYDEFEYYYRLMERRQEQFNKR